MQATLIPYPETSKGPSNAVRVEMSRTNDVLWLRFTVEGEIDSLLWPASAEPERADGLWRHTCFEVFVGGPSGYHEFNLSPSGQWASYAFDGYREGMTNARQGAEVEPLDGASDQVALEARIQLPPGAATLGLSAVIEDLDGEKTYWALAHPSDKPDFHHPDSFTLALPAPERTRDPRP